MKWRDSGGWALNVALPCGVRAELKLVLRHQGSVTWVGCGTGDAVGNILLETRLGRAGARASHFVSGPLPCGLTVEDVAAPPEGAGAGLGVASDLALATRGEVGRSTGAPRTTAVAAQAAPGVAGASMDAAALLAGAAAGAGRAVTYTVTTTTVSSVTVDGVNTDPDACSVRAAMPAGQKEAVCGPRGDCGDKRALPADAEDKSSVVSAMAAARAHNADVPRLAPVKLEWLCEGAGKLPSEVRVRGSWDAWARELSLEPAPGGGFWLVMVVPEGVYECKFIVDGVWCTSGAQEVTTCDNKNNVVRTREAVLAPTLMASEPPVDTDGAVVLSLPAPPVGEVLECN